MKKTLLLFIGFMTFAMGVNAETYTHTFKKGDLDKSATSACSVTLSDVVWNATAANNIGWSNDKGIQIGKKAEACNNYSLTTSAFKDFTIKSVTVSSSIASSGDAKLTIQAGNAKSEEYTLTEDKNASYTLTCKESGDIKISWTATQRAYYVKQIVVEYELPSDMVDVEEPVFKTPTDKIYADQVKVIAQTENDQTLVLYYTLDGTDPSYEDYNSDPRVGTTESGRAWQIMPTITDSLTVNRIRVMAVKEDGESVYKSEIVEAEYIVSTTKPFVPATSINTENKYAFFANDSIADALVPKVESGFLQDRKVIKHDQCIESVKYDAFTFSATSGGYTIQDAAGRYMYPKSGSNEFSFAKEKPANAVWSISIKDGKAEIKNGSSTIYYVWDGETEEGKFGCYTAAGENMELPELYMLCEYPEYTITPEHNSEVRGLQEITISCAEGISVSQNFKLRAIGNMYEHNKYEIYKTYKCEKIDANTLKFTIDEPLESQDNIEVKLCIEGDIYLNPQSMKYPMPKGKYDKDICTYKHLGVAKAAVITEVTPANNSKVEKLGYILFTFNNYVSVPDNTEKKAKLHLEGSNELIAVEYTTLKEGSDSEHIGQMQGALKVTEPIKKNGTYLLEIEDGYFEDRNGNAVKSMTLKYIVENDGTGIEDIIAEGETSWLVYDITGKKVLDTTNASDLNTLAKGIYIVNGKKYIVK